MGRVYLSTLELVKILEWNETKIRTIPRQEYVSKSTSSTDIECTVVEPRIITLDCRFGWKDRIDLYILRSSHSWLDLTESGLHIDYVYIENAEIEWAGEEHKDNPFLAKLTLVCSAS